MARSKQPHPNMDAQQPTLFKAILDEQLRSAHALLSEAAAKGAPRSTERSLHAATREETSQAVKVGAGRTTSADAWAGRAHFGRKV